MIGVVFFLGLEVQGDCVLPVGTVHSEQGQDKLFQGLILTNQ